MTPDEKTVLSALELLDIGTEQPIRVWAFKRILDRVEGLRNEIGLRDEAITRLEAEFDATCNAEEMRQVREDNKRLQAEVARLETELRSVREELEWANLPTENGAAIRTATEAALRWAWEQGVQYDYPGAEHDWVRTGLAALLNETNNQGETE